MISLDAFQDELQKIALVVPSRPIAYRMHMPAGNLVGLLPPKQMSNKVLQTAMSGGLRTPAPILSPPGPSAWQMTPHG